MRNQEDSTCESHGSSRGSASRGRPAHPHGVQQRHARSGAERRRVRAATDAGTWFEVADDVTHRRQPDVRRDHERGTVKVGVKEDQPGLGYLDPTTGERTGFDVDIARWIAASLGFDEDKIEFTAIPSANREQAIVNGDIDYYVGTYSITDKRKEQISFAGPYFVTGQGLLVAADNDDITGPDDLAGKTVCSATGSTSIQRIKDEYPERRRRSSTRTRSASSSSRTARWMPSRPTRRS